MRLIVHHKITFGKKNILNNSKWIIIFVLLFIRSTINAQEHNVLVGSQLGNVLDIYSGFPQSKGGWGIDAAWTRRGDTTNIWEGLWNFPESGLVFSYTDFGNDDTLGSSFGLMYRFQLFQQLGRRWFLTEGMDLGAAAYTKPYHITENPGNIAIGARFSALVRFSVSLRFALSRRWHIYTGFTFHHASNGHTGLPNVGINIPMLNFGLLYYFKTDDGWSKATKKILDFNRKMQMNMRLAYGINRFGSETGPSNGPYYSIYLVSVYADKRVSAINRIQFGLDAYYNSGYREYLESQRPPELSPGFANASVITIWVGNEFLIGRLGLIFQIGYGLYNPFLKYYVKQDESISNAKAYIPTRIGAQYYLKDHFHGAKQNAFLGLYVKANMGQADFLEFSIGVKF